MKAQVQTINIIKECFYPAETASAGGRAGEVGSSLGCSQFIVTWIDVRNALVRLGMSRILYVNTCVLHHVLHVITSHDTAPPPLSNSTGLCLCMKVWQRSCSYLSTVFHLSSRTDPTERTREGKFLSRPLLKQALSSWGWHRIAMMRVKISLRALKGQNCVEISTLRCHINSHVAI